MEAIKVPRTVIDTKYKAKDGKVLDSAYECNEYELQLDFDAFVFDPEKTKKYAPENLQHFLYHFITNFQEPERRNINMLFPKKNKIGSGWNENKKIYEYADELDSEFEKRIRTEILKCFEKDNELRLYGSRNPDRLKSLLKENLTVFESFEFLLGTGLVTHELLSDYLFKQAKPTTTGRYHVDAKEFNKEIEEHEKNRLMYNSESHVHFFRMAFYRDSIDAWKYLITLNVFDVSIFLNNSPLNGRWLTRDFVSGLLFGLSEGLLGYDIDAKARWDEKRSEWLKMILKLDLDCIKLWKRKTVHYGVYMDSYDTNPPFKVKDGKIGTIHGGGEKIDTILYQSVDDILLDAGIIGNEVQISVFKIFVGNNMRKNNSITICKPETTLATDVFRRLVVTFEKRTDLGKISINHELHALDMEYFNGYESRSFNSSNIQKSRNVYFATSDTNQTYRTLSDVCALYNHNYGGDYLSQEKAILKLSEYLNKPDELFEIISIFLTDGMPLDMDKINEIKQLEKEVEEKKRKIDKIKKSK